MRSRRLDVGEHGEIAYREADGQVTASFYYRNHHGLRRRIDATATSKSAARRRALDRLEQALTGGGARYTSRTTLAEVAEEWHAQVVELVEAGRRSPTTSTLYRGVLDGHVLPAVGSLRLSELSTARLDHFVHGVRRSTGYSTAKLCRTVLSGVCGYAVRRDAMRVNPVRDISPLERGESEPVRALTAEECARWLAILDADAYAIRKDLPDLVRFLLGTGVRIGEAVAVRWDDVDLDRGVVAISRTVVRVVGQGLVAKKPKTRAGVRVLRLPGSLVDMLRARSEQGQATGPVFPDAVGGYRDRNNVERDFRLVRAGTEFEWVVPHTYRKTVATILDAQGLSARTIADQLGHSRISMTQDVYMGRRTVDSAAAVALDGLTASPVERTYDRDQRSA